MNSQQLKAKLMELEEVNEDTLTDELITFVDVRGKIDGEDGAFFFELEDGVYYLPYLDHVDGSGDYRPKAVVTKLKKVDKMSLQWLKKELMFLNAKVNDFKHIVQRASE